MKTLSATLVLLLSISTFGMTQDDPTIGKQKEAISKLASFMEGTWQGPGWMKKGQSAPISVNTTETVEVKTGGTTLLINGLGMLPESDNIVHDALAIIHYDVATGTYQFGAHLATGLHKQVTGTLEDNVFVWGFDLPNNASIRYTITFADNTWKEVGEYSPDTNQYYQFFEMNLTKQ
jgi:hypothetical protein